MRSALAPRLWRSFWRPLCPHWRRLLHKAGLLLDHNADGSHGLAEVDARLVVIEQRRDAIIARAGQARLRVGDLEAIGHTCIVAPARLRQLIDDLIDVSKIDNDLMSLNFQPMCLSQLLGLLKSSVDPIMRERKLNLELREFDGAGLWIYADSERLHQGFRNLLENAVKYTPDGGSITVDGRALPGFIEVTVADTGIGISPENLSLIFSKYSQSGPALHSSGKTKFKGGGPGLGLPITRGIIEAHGGTIWVESPGCDEQTCPGSTFHVLIPIRTEATDPKVEKLLGRFPKAQVQTDGEENLAADTAAT